MPCTTSSVQLQLDPRNGGHLGAVTVTYAMMRAYKQAKESANRLIALKPNDIHPQLIRAGIDAHERADTRPLHTLVEKILTHDPAAAATLVHHQCGEVLVYSRFVGARPCRGRSRPGGAA